MSNSNGTEMFSDSDDAVTMHADSREQLGSMRFISFHFIYLQTT